MKWFKFYGQDYLSDPKVLALTACERSCWISLLAYASVNDNGMITYLSEEQLMIQAGVSPMHDEWGATQGVLEKFKKLQMITLDNELITVLNWQKRQETSLTSYERVKRYREKKRNDNVNDNDRVEENRIDKKKDTKKSPFIPDGKLTTEPDPDENGRPVKEKKDVPMPHEWVEIWNRFSTWKATGKSGTPPNPSALKQLLPIARQTRDLTAAIIKKRGKYSTEEFEFATRQYAMEICNRTKDKSSFYLHRFPLYEFLTHKGIFEKYVNR